MFENTWFLYTLLLPVTSLGLRRLCYLRSSVRVTFTTPRRSGHRGDFRPKNTICFDNFLDCELQCPFSACSVPVVRSPTFADIYSTPTLPPLPLPVTPSFKNRLTNKFLFPPCPKLLCRLPVTHMSLSRGSLLASSAALQTKKVAYEGFCKALRGPTEVAKSTGNTFSKDMY